MSKFKNCWCHNTILNIEDPLPPSLSLSLSLWCYRILYSVTKEPFVTSLMKAKFNHFEKKILLLLGPHWKWCKMNFKVYICFVLWKWDNCSMNNFRKLLAFFELKYQVTKILQCSDKLWYRICYTSKSLLSFLIGEEILKIRVY